MSEQNSAASASVNRAKPYQLMLFPLNNGATNVYYVLVLSYIATFGSKVLALSMIFASVMVTGMRLFDAITDPIIGALMDRTNGKFGKFRPFMVIGNLIMAVSILVLYCLTPLIPASMEWARYVAFVALYALDTVLAVLTVLCIWRLVVAIKRKKTWTAEQAANTANAQNQQ